MRKVLGMMALVAGFLASVPSMAFVPPCHVLAPVVTDTSAAAAPVYGMAMFAGSMVLTAFGPEIIQQTNPLCEWFTCYDDHGNPFVTDATGTHPRDY